MSWTMAQPARKLLGDDEKLAFLVRATQEMAVFTFPFVAGIVRVEDPTTGAFVGSAWRVERAGRRAVVTAAHVIDEASASGRLVAVTACRGAPPHPAPASDWLRAASDDLALWWAPSDYPGTSSEDASAPQVGYWPSDAIDVSASSTGSDQLFVHGFPQTRTSFSPCLGGLVARSFPYAAMQREEPLREVSLGAHEFALHYEVEGLLSIAGGQGESQWPHGLSGSPVWRLDVGGRGVAEWKPARARMVGTAIRWVPNDQAMIVLHARRVVALLDALA
jgi:hypothetical protein